MSAAKLVLFELSLLLSLPTIEGNVDYRDFCDQLLHRQRSGLEF